MRCWVPPNSHPKSWLNINVNFDYPPLLYLKIITAEVVLGMISHMGYHKIDLIQDFFLNWSGGEISFTRACSHVAEM